MSKYFGTDGFRVEAGINWNVSRGHPPGRNKYLTYLLEQRPSESMSDEQFEKITPWNEEVKQRCQN